MRHLSHVDFFKVCDAMRTYRDWLENTRPNKADAARFLSDKTGLNVSTHTIDDVMTATGISWEPTRKPARSLDHVRRHEIRTLTRALRLLFVKLGEEVPQSLQELYDVVCARHSCEQVNGQHHPIGVNEL